MSIFALFILISTDHNKLSHLGLISQACTSEKLFLSMELRNEEESFHQKNKRGKEYSTDSHESMGNIHTVTDKLEEGQVNLPLPGRAFLQSYPIAGGREHISTADRDQLATFISPSHVIQHCCIINERIQLSKIKEMK